MGMGCKFDLLDVLVISADILSSDLLNDANTKSKNS